MKFRLRVLVITGFQRSVRRHHARAYIIIIIIIITRFCITRILAFRQLSPYSRTDRDSMHLYSFIESSMMNMITLSPCIICVSLQLPEL
jgi:hypothetical protein